MSKARGLADLGNVYNDGALSNRNLIINGDMGIDQRNAGGSVTVNAGAAFYGVDRFRLSGVSASGVFTGVQSTDAPTGFSTSLKLTVTTADASITAADLYYINHNIEGYNTRSLNLGTANAKAITLSFWVKSSVTGSFGGSFTNDDVSRAYPYNYTISVANTWEYKTVTITGDTTGTWLINNLKGLRLYWGLGTGSDYTGTADQWNSGVDISPTGSVNLISTAAATFYITGVQLEVGDTATPFEHRSYGQELALCKRYYQEIDAAFRQSCCIGYRKNANHIYPTGGQNHDLPVEMRTSPTLLNTGMSVTFTSLLNDNWVSTFYANLGSYTAGHSFGTNSRTVWYDSTVPGNNPFPADTPISITLGEVFKLDAEL